MPGAIKGEKVKIHIVKVLSSHAFGKIIEIIKKSEYREEVDCNTYKRCGGCNLRHINYEETLNIKQNTVQNLVNKNLKQNVQVNKTIGMGNPYHYRNKAQYPLGLDKEGKAKLGIYANRSHEIIEMDNCLIQNPISEEIAKFISEFIKTNNISVYNEKTGKGIFRHIVIKIGIQTNQIMCILVVNSKNIPKEKELCNKLIEKFPNIKTIVKNINNKNTNVILGKENVNLYGNGYITDILGDYKFKISPMSFYQTNPVQTEVLYNIAIEKSNLTGEETVFDLYCGIGTISIFLAKHSKKVYGIEIVEQAINDAKENARINGVENVEFYAGDVESTFDRILRENNVKPNVICVDPPRKGLDGTTLKNIIEIKPEKVIYISCNPATLARDLKALEKEYDIKEIQPVDMFPFTGHVECVAVLCRK